MSERRPQHLHRRGSHAFGRIDHVLTGDQAGADPDRVNAILQRLPLKHIEMQPGDALFFHANLLHRSDRNPSENPRWAPRLTMICCYNAARNDPYKDAHHPRYTPLAKVPGDAILTAGAKRFADSKDDVARLDINRDSSARTLTPRNRSATLKPPISKTFSPSV